VPIFHSTVFQTVVCCEADTVASTPKLEKIITAYKTAVNAIRTKYITINNDKHRSTEENL